MRQSVFLKCIARKKSILRSIIIDNIQISHSLVIAS